MRFRYRSIRARTFFLVLMPLVSLVGLYAYATTAAASNALALERSTTVRDSLANPIGLFTAQVQQERLDSAVFLARPTSQAASALSAQKPKTDAALSTMRQAVSKVDGDENLQVRDALSVLRQETAGLSELRTQVSSQAISKESAEQAYTSVNGAAYQAIQASFLQMPDVDLVSQSSAVLRAAEAQDALLQAQTLLASDAAGGTFPAADRVRFATLTGQYTGLLDEAVSDLDLQYRAPFAKVIASPQFKALNTLNAEVISAPPGQTGVSIPTYGRAVQTVSLGLAIDTFAAGQTLASALHATAGPINERLIITGGVGLVAIIVSIGLSVWIGRGIIRGLAGLRGDALELARQRLPRVMARLSSGQDVNVEAEAPLLPMPVGVDEIGQVRQAFNTVQRAAIESAAGQARLRSGVATIFKNLALRSQSLLYQQLLLLDRLEQQADRPEELTQLFQIDHLATRMRRSAEGLLVLAGEQPGRTWTEPVPMVDALRGAVAEVVDYARIHVSCSSSAALQGHAVADVIHLVAELVDNACAFSPPDTQVRVVGSDVVRGFVVEIEDRGLGIPPAVAHRLNAILADPPPFNPAESEQLGLYVAARLGQRHEVGIHLRPSPYGGTTAIVLIPRSLIVEETRRSLTALAGGGAQGNANGANGIPARASAAPPVSALDNDLRQPTAANYPSQLARPEFELPRRNRQANLPASMLKPGAARTGLRRAAGPGVQVGMSAEGLREAFADIQIGMDRANSENLRKEHGR